VFGQGCGLGEADDVTPAETGQALGGEFGAERPRNQCPHKRKQQAHGPGEVDVGEVEKVRVVGTLDADERRGVHQRQQHAQVEARLHSKGTDADERHRKRQHQHWEIVQVGQHQKQVQAGEQHRHGGPEKEPIDLWRRIVHRGEEAARHGGQNHRAAAVGPAQQDPQHRGDDDRGDGRKRRIEHQTTVKEWREPTQPPVTIHGAPAVLAFALDGRLQAAAVLPQVDPFAQAIQRVGKQQGVAVVQRLALGLQGVDLVTQGAPAFQRCTLLSVFQPLACGFQNRLDAVEKFRRPMFDGVERIVEGIHHRQQVDHAPAQFLGVTHRLRPRAFVRQLADHQFEGVESGDHAAAQSADFFTLHIARQKALAVDLSIGKPLGHRAIEHGHQAARPEHRTHYGGDRNTEEDFFGSRLGHIPYRQRVIHHRQGDQRQGVASEHQGIVVGGAQVHREEQQSARPQCDHHHQNVRRLHEHRHKKHRRRRAHQGADGAVQGLGTGGADKRAGDDVHRGHRPVRTRHLHQHRDIERDHRRGESTHAVEPVAGRRKTGKESVQSVAASKARSTRSAASISVESMSASTSRRRRTNWTSTACTSSRPRSVRLKALARRSWTSSVRHT